MMGEVELQPDDAIEQRLDTILLERIAVGSPAMAWSLGVLTVAAAYYGHWTVAVASSLAQTCALLAWWRIRRHKVVPRLAGPLSFGLWLTAETSVLIALAVFGDTTQEIWLALLLWAYGAMQLKPRWAAAAFIVGPLGWLALVLALQFDSLLLHLVSIAAATAVGMLAFGANRAVVRNLEELRARDVARSAELAHALAAAERELAERQVAEAEREKLRDQFVAAQRMEAIGVLAGGIAHDMNNVLASILGIATIRRDTAVEGEADDLEVIITAAERGASLTRSLLGFSRRAQYFKEPLALATVAQEVIALLERTIPKGIRLVHDFDPTVWVEADRTHIEQALLNLCINAVQALGERGRIEIGVHHTRLSLDEAASRGLSAGDWAVLTVHDDGPGMDPAVISRAFEPFFTTKGVGEGSGLGLAMVWGTIESHGGTTTITSPPGHGTCIECFLPRIDALVRLASTPSASRAMTGPLRVLVVDDEPSLRKTFARALTRAGHQVEVAADGIEALEIARSAAAPFQAVVLDMSMPRMNGAECYRRLRELQPDLPIVCMSGYALNDETRALLGGDVIFVAKPIAMQDLFEALALAVEVGVPASRQSRP